MIKIIDEAQFEGEIKTSDGQLKIVEFFARWCNPCNMLAPVLEKLAKNYEEVQIYKIDVDTNSDLANNLNIQSIPTMLFYKNGDILKQVMGLQPMESLEETIETLK